MRIRCSRVHPIKVLPELTDTNFRRESRRGNGDVANALTAHKYRNTNTVIVAVIITAYDEQGNRTDSGPLLKRATKNRPKIAIPFCDASLKMTISESNRCDFFKIK